MIKFINSFVIMIIWKNCLLLAWMLPKCVMGLSLSPEMTLIVSIAFGSLLLIIIIAVVTGCIYVWFTKKQDKDITEENSSSRRNRLRRLNSIHPSREISMAEFEYLHNKSRAEYAMMQGSNALPGYLDSEESALHPEFRANGINRSASPPPPYDHNQEMPDSNASASLESDLPPLPATKTSTAAPQNSASSISSTRNNSRNSETTEAKENDDVNSRTRSKKNQKAARIINVKDPDRLRLQKLSLTNKLKYEIETGEGSRWQTVDENDSAHSCGRESSKIEQNCNQQNKDNNDGYDKSTPQHSRTNDRSPTMDRAQSKQIGNDEQRKHGRRPLSDIPLTGKRHNGPEQQPKFSRTSEVPQRDVRNDRYKTKEQPLRAGESSPPIQQPQRYWVSDNSNARSRRSGSYQEEHGEDSTYGDHHQYQHENLDDNGRE